jgi:hypothetical protein
MLVNQFNRKTYCKQKKMRCTPKETFIIVENNQRALSRKTGKVALPTDSGT